jgi:surface antigen
MILCPFSLQATSVHLSKIEAHAVTLRQRAHFCVRHNHGHHGVSPHPLKESMMRSVMLSLLFVFSLSACQTSDMGTKEAVGTGLGAIAGGLSGSQIGKGPGKLIAVGAGTLLGAFLGREVGASLDKADAEFADRAATRAFTNVVGDKVPWNNPRTGNSGSVKALRDGYAPSGQYCREYQNTVVVGGRTEHAYGTACRQVDGSWKLVA